ncbi:MAG: carboxypeptidase regulatory-like domain-containing protein, partial [Bacteroidaceae bacterium]|nr:carboxypeptidase regulatory-like domain-containing protein [Bacteroidaceae bacterium]
MKKKITFLLLTLISVQLTLSAQTDQRINLAFQNEALPTVLKKLEQASSYRILFTYDDVQSYQVTATLHDSTIFQAIEKVLEGKPLTYTQKDNQYIIILSAKVKQKPLAIRGTVMNEKNEPMPFCNVLLLTPDSTFVNGCVTKEDGSFAMAGVEGTPYLLKTSYIGYVTSTQP